MLMKAFLSGESVNYAVSRLAMFVNVLCRIVSTDYPNTPVYCLVADVSIATEPEL
jgi:hypothetical protein